MKRDFYQKFFSELLKYNKRKLEGDEEIWFAVINNAWKVVKEWKVSDVVSFLYEERDFKLMRENQRLKFLQPAGAYKPTRVKEGKIVKEKHPIKMGVSAFNSLIDIAE